MYIKDHITFFSWILSISIAFKNKFVNINLDELNLHIIGNVLSLFFLIKWNYLHEYSCLFVLDRCFTRENHVIINCIVKRQSVLVDEVSSVGVEDKQKHNA